MKIKKIKVYSFEELSKEAKEKALSDFNLNNDMPFLTDLLKDELDIILKENHIESTNAKMYYSLSYSQGDGIMFYGNFDWKGQNITIEHKGHYYHSYSKDITWNDFEGGEKEQEEEKLAKEFEEIYQDICSKLEKFGYNQVEYESSEEYFISICKANNYTFQLSGKMENL